MKTLLLEAGPCTNTGLSTQSIPLLASRIHHSNVDWNYEMEPQSVGGSVFPEGRVPIPRAKVLGGCAEINFMLHVRGTAGDYDGWAEEVSDSSWNSTFMSKMEDKYESFVEPLLPERPHPYIGTFLSAANRTEYGVQQDYNERSEVRSGAFVYVVFDHITVSREYYFHHSFTSLEHHTRTQVQTCKQERCSTIKCASNAPSSNENVHEFTRAYECSRSETQL